MLELENERAQRRGEQGGFRVEQSVKSRVRQILEGKDNDKVCEPLGRGPRRKARTHPVCHPLCDILAEQLDLGEEVHLDERHTPRQTLLVSDDVQLRVPEVALERAARQTRQSDRFSGCELGGWQCAGAHM